MLSYLIPLLLPFFSFCTLFFLGPFFRKFGVLTSFAFCKLSVIFMFFNLSLCFTFFVLNKTSDFITELTLLNFFKTHYNLYSSDLILLNDSFVHPNTTFFVDYSFLFDSITIIMLFVIIGVSGLVQLFSTEYMAHDPYISRFFAFLNFFSLCMLILVTAGNFIQMFIGWEGVGVASFLLIGFWFSRVQAVKCALKAVIINRVGDCALLLAFSLIAFAFSDLSYIGFFGFLEVSLQNDLFLNNTNYLHFVELFSNSYVFSTLTNSFLLFKPIYFLNSKFNIIFFIGLLILVGAFAKSAQFGLHTWLPDAMEGPTPVSALIHAATMVTAGVFLIIRCAPLFLINEILSDVLIIFGSITALFGASVAAAQFDIKKIIAYSTCSQLGYMVAACGVANFDLAIFHLTTHAFFKAGLFLCAGLIIHALGDEQDIRKMGGLVRLLPITYLAVFICSFCLGGLPFFSGFYSKDAIIESAFNFDNFGWFNFSILLLAAFLTAFYSIRFFYYVFWRDLYAGYRSKVFLIGETSSSAFAVLTLSFSSILLGFYFVFGNFKLFFIQNSLSINIINNIKASVFDSFWSSSSLLTLNFVDTYFLFQSLHILLPFSIFFSLLFVIFISFYFSFFYKNYYFLSFVSYYVQNKNSSMGNCYYFFRHFYNFFAKAWLFDIFITKLARNLFFFSRSFVQRNIESGLFELLLVLFPIRSLISMQNLLVERTTTGDLSLYVRNIIFGSLFLFLFSFSFLV